VKKHILSKLWAALSGKENAIRWATPAEIAAVHETQVAGLLYGICNPRDVEGNSLGFFPLLDGARVVIEDVVKRFPPPLHTASTDVNHAAWLQAVAEADRVQAKAARIAATKQSGGIASEIATELKLWADAKEHEHRIPIA
jgi:hypothetical protein